MASPIITAETQSYLQEIGLAIWICMHPMTYSGSERPKADKTRVHVQLAGPGIDISPWGYGANTAEAVANALKNVQFRARRSGLPGALARLELAIGDLSLSLMGWGDDDDIPF